MPSLHLSSLTVAPIELKKWKQPFIAILHAPVCPRPRRSLRCERKLSPSVDFDLEYTACDCVGKLPSDEGRKVLQRWRAIGLGPHVDVNRQTLELLKLGKPGVELGPCRRVHVNGRRPPFGLVVVTVAVLPLGEEEPKLELLQRTGNDAG